MRGGVGTEHLGAGDEQQGKGKRVMEEQTTLGEAADTLAFAAVIGVALGATITVGKWAMKRLLSEAGDRKEREL